MATHYETLGITPTSTTQEIRKAYLRRARALHPDRQQGKTEKEARRAEQAMQQVNVAWNVLSDPSKKAEYDSSLRPRSMALPGGAASVASPMVRKCVSSSSLSAKSSSTKCVASAGGNAAEQSPIGTQPASVTLRRLAPGQAEVSGATGSQPQPEAERVSPSGQASDHPTGTQSEVPSRGVLPAGQSTAAASMHGTSSNVPC